MKKLLTLISLLIIVSILSSCGFISINNPTDSFEETTIKEETTELTSVKYDPDYESEINKFKKSLSGKTYEGSIKIAIAGIDVICGDDKTSIVISQDYADRNKAVEEVTGVSVATEIKNPETMLTEIKQSTYSGTYYSDLIMIPQKYIGTYYVENALVNLLSLPGFDYKEEFIFSSSVSAATGGNGIYAVSGYASYNPDDIGCIFFNKTLMYNVEPNIYKVVKDGKWTVDYYLNLIKQLDNNFYSYCTQNSSQNIADLFFFGLNGSLSYSELNKYPYITVGSEENTKKISAVSSMINTKKSSISSIEAINTFLSGKSLFFIDTLGMMSKISNTELDWGVLPFPKYDENQKTYYSSPYYGSTLFFAVPPTATNYEECADVISAFNIMSYGYSTDKYIENASYYYLRDTESIQMLAEFVSNPIFDFSYSFGDTNYTSISNGTYSALRNTVDGISSIERYVNMYNDLFNNSMYYLFDTN